MPEQALHCWRIGIRRHRLAALRMQVEATDFLHRQALDEPSAFVQCLRPFPLQFRQTQRLGEMQGVDVRLSVAGKAIRLIKDQARIEPLVLARRRPGQRALGKIGIMQVNGIDKVARLSPTRERK